VTALDALQGGREAYDHRAWAQAYAQLLAADAIEPLELADLERLAMAAELIGRYEDSSDALARSHQEGLRVGDLSGAARAAFWLGFGLIHRGEFARGGGWVARAAGLIADEQLDCVEQGYVLLPGAIRALDEGQSNEGLASFEEVSRIAARFGDLDLATLGRLGRGTAHIALGEIERGVVLLDEAMVAVTADEVSPIVVGIVYCATIEACQGIFDLRRAQEWTAALTRWCESQPELQPFRGRCLLYQAELMQFHGDWQDAIAQTRIAYDQLSRPPPEPAVAEAHYQQGELHRLRGEFAAAEEAYREASQQGRQPEPGRALLRLAQGQAVPALAVIRRAVNETQDRLARARLLDPMVEIALAAGDLDAAREAASELTGVAESSRAPLVRAMATRAEGAVALADGDANAAIGMLRGAWSQWRALEAPYEAARVRVLIGEACRALGDEDTAAMEFDAARAVFHELGAAPALARLDAMAGGRGGVGGPDGLTTRELEVLRLVAAGLTNRAIATELVISEKTVARHMSNIFTKLDLSSRSAATAYAYEHGIRRST
jgi:DNA-binding CsgD family transcriptional regulator/tetratricopeptide (TPR) repeat protein